VRLAPGRSDAVLLRRFRAGDESAFAALHARYAESIRAYAAYMLRGSAHDPDDAAQDVFLRAYTALRRDERDVDVRPWLYRIAHNRCIDALRRPVGAELDADRVAGGGAGGTAGDPVAAIEQREAMRALLRDIGTLTDAQRSALLLRELGGLSHEAVGEALGITPTSSRMLVHRARVALVDAAEARDTSCRDVRDRIVAASDTGEKLARRDRRHLAGCDACRSFQRAHAGVQRELSLLAPIGLAPVAWAGVGLGAGAGAGAAGVGVGAGGAGVGAKLAVGACCALLAGGGAAVGVTEVTSRHREPAATPPVSKATAHRPAATTTTTASAVAPAATTAAASAKAPAKRSAPAAPATATIVTTTRTAAAAPPPPAATVTTPPERTIDLAGRAPTPTTPAAPEPPAETIDLAGLGG